MREFPKKGSHLKQFIIAEKLALLNSDLFQFVEDRFISIEGTDAKGSKIITLTSLIRTHMSFLN